MSCAKSDTVVLPGEIDDKGVCKYISMCIYVYDYKICIYIHTLYTAYIYILGFLSITSLLPRVFVGL